MIATFTRVSGRFGVDPKEAERFFKFMVVGAIGFLVDLHGGVASFLAWEQEASTLSGRVWRRLFLADLGKCASFWRFSGLFGCFPRFLRCCVPACFGI